MPLFLACLLSPTDDCVVSPVVIPSPKKRGRQQSLPVPRTPTPALPPLGTKTSSSNAPPDITEDEIHYLPQPPIDIAVLVGTSSPSKTRRHLYRERPEEVFVANHEGSPQSRQSWSQDRRVRQMAIDPATNAVGPAIHE